MKLTRQQIDKLMQSLLQEFGNNNNLHPVTVDIICYNLELLQAKSKEVSMAIEKVPNIEKLKEKQTFEHRYFCEKYKIKGNIPDNFKQEYSKDMLAVLNKMPEVRDALNVIETEEHEIDIKIITDLQGCTVLNKLNFPMLFKEEVKEAKLKVIK